MFNNLIESSSHAREFKRRGSFVLFTAATYFLLFAIAGVISIYAYDATLEDPNTEIVVMLPPVDMPTQPAAPVRNSAPPRNSSNSSDIPVRQNHMASVNVPQVVPKTTSANPNPELPIPDRGPWRTDTYDSNPGTVGSPGSGTVGGTGTPTSRAVVIEAEPPLPEPTPKPVPRVISKGVITSQAISLPKPPYPVIARQAGAHGPVSVQVLIDETGRVISAKAIDGNPMLRIAAQQAASQARFSPTMLNDQAVKVSGVITYNFILQ